MIFGRPANLWLAAATGVLNLAFLIAGQVGYPINDAVIAGANLALAALIALIAGQPPTLNPGDAYTVVTTPGQPNVSKVANTNVTPIPPNAGVADAKPTD